MCIHIQSKHDKYILSCDSIKLTFLYPTSCTSEQTSLVLPLFAAPPPDPTVLAAVDLSIQR